MTEVVPNVRAITISGTDVYVGGAFTHAGDVAASNVARWDGSAWHALGGGVNGSVEAIAVSCAEVYVGGIFTEAGGAPARYIARWDGHSWSAVDTGIGSPVMGSVSALAVSGGELYAGGNWTHYQMPGNQNTSAPAVAGDTVYVGGWEELYALSIETGGVRWTFQLEKGSDDSYYVDPLVVDNTVYFGGWRHFYALDTETGNEKWRLQAGGDFYSDPVIADGIIYFGNTMGDLGALFSGQPTGSLHAVDAHSGQELWNFSMEGGISGSPAVSDGTIYLGTDAGTLYAVK